jgi:hypothetical protein
MNDIQEKIRHIKENLESNITSKCNRSDTNSIIPFDTMYKYYKDNEDISILN